MDTWSQGALIYSVGGGPWRPVGAQPLPFVISGGPQGDGRLLFAMNDTAVCGGVLGGCHVDNTGEQVVLIQTRQVSKQDIAFGAQPTGAPGAVLYGRLNNAGAARMFVFNVSAPGGANAADFSVVDDRCSQQSVAPGSSCVIGVRFTAGADGARSAALTVPNDSEPGTQTIVVSGTGVPRDAGPVGPIGPAGLVGPVGPVGPAGPTGASLLERLIECHRRSGSSRTAAVCWLRTPAAPGTTLRITLSRGGAVKASGTATASGGLQQVDLRAGNNCKRRGGGRRRCRLASGQYLLKASYRQGDEPRVMYAATGLH